ncbi:MAG: DUF1566 domain-containing protein [Bacteroidales bacterium]|nr:DUF1566 domain-containing protein [Bacteroidales bacterium]
MKKVFGFAALLLAFVACNKVETDITPAGQSSAGKGITITATLAPKTADTKAVADNGDNKITVTWAQNEHIAILYEVGGTKYMADASIKSVDAGGSATIEFTVVEGTPDNTPCTLVYPLAAAKDDHTGVKDAATLLSAQDGTLSANLDVRVGAGTIQTATPGLSVTTQPAAQFAIFKFTVKNYNGSEAISANPLTVTIGTQDYVITPAAATDVLYAALPAVSDEKVSFDATDGSDRTYTCAKLSASFAAGKYYQTTLKMREYVDLGIVVEGKKIKWATCNVGASKPEDYGDYFAWGETATKAEYKTDWSNYFDTSDGGSTFTRYTAGEKIELRLRDDAACANWGGSWRMPTRMEMDALLALSRKWETYEGVNGYKFTRNGKTLFLPAAGYRYNTVSDEVGSRGYYWSSTIHQNYSVNAWYVYFNSEYANMGSSGGRYYGQSVRPVSE